LATEKEWLVPSLPALEGVSLGLFGPESKLRKFCQWLSCHPHFDTLTILLIVVSSTCLAIDLPRLDPDSATKASLDQLNLWLTGFFVLEMLLKIVAKGFLFAPDAYLRSGWNVLDFVIVLISILGLLADLVPAFGQLKSLRILRVLRPLRLLRPPSSDDGLSRGPLSAGCAARAAAKTGSSQRSSLARDSVKRRCSPR
jgi:hypothetical protein